jgi:ribonucleotide reductase beta subunit family protein with ferritin-like domain
VDLRHDSKTKRLAEAAERRNWLKQKEIDLHKDRFEWEKLRASEQSLAQSKGKGVNAHIEKAKIVETVSSAQQNMIEANL